MDTCKKCNKEISIHEDVWNNSHCNPCYSIVKRKLVIMFFCLGLIGLIIGLIAGSIEFDYGLNKCFNLKSSESSYDFDKTVELDANYNSNCYYLKNHPFAYPLYLFGGAGIGMLLGIGISMIILMFKTELLFQ